MTQSLSYYPGYEATIFLETKDGYGVRQDSATQPTVTQIIFPDMSLSDGYPQDLTKIETGLYYFKFTLPTGASSVGSYLVDVSFTNPANNEINTATYQVIVTVPFGNFNATIGN